MRSILWFFALGALLRPGHALNMFHIINQTEQRIDKLADFISRSKVDVAVLLGMENFDHVKGWLRTLQEDESSSLHATTLKETLRTTALQHKHTGELLDRLDALSRNFSDPGIEGLTNFTQTLGTRLAKASELSANLTEALDALKGMVKAEEDSSGVEVVRLGAMEDRVKNQSDIVDSVDKRVGEVEKRLREVEDGEVVKKKELVVRLLKSLQEKTAALNAAITKMEEKIGRMEGGKEIVEVETEPVLDFIRSVKMATATGKVIDLVLESD